MKGPNPEMSKSPTFLPKQIRLRYLFFFFFSFHPWMNPSTSCRQHKRRNPNPHGSSGALTAGPGGGGGTLLVGGTSPLSTTGM
jgi:hypothetical protein